MQRRTFLKTMALGTTTTLLHAGDAIGAQVAGAGQSGNNQRRQPDVVMISIEDIAAHLGCYGHPIVKTPNMDALARRGVFFTNAHCPASVCNPSRAAIITGLRCSTLGVFDNPTNWRLRMPAGHRPMPTTFREAGYTTVQIGKIVHNSAAFKNNPGGEEIEEAMWDVSEKTWGKDRRNEPKRPSQPYPDKDENAYLKKAVAWGSIGHAAEDGTDAAVANRAIKFMREERDPNKPMFLAVGLHSPHYQLTAPDEFLAMYSPDSIELPDYPKDDLADVPGDYSYNLTEEKWLTDSEKRELTAAYYACISYADYAVGKIIKALEEDGRLENTIVCLWGDHGIHLGEHGLWQKTTLFEETTRVPFIMAGPGIGRGEMSRPAELIDIYPTLADLAGVSVREPLEGISMRPVLADPNRPWKKGALTEVKKRGTATIRTDRYRYSRWAEGGEEFYDRRSDPREIHNLAGDTAHAAALEEHRLLMNEGWRALLPS